jgi:hypothetical protein
MEAVGAPVLKLYRADYGGVDVAGMKPGELRELTRAEIHQLRQQAGKKAQPGPTRPAALPARRHGHGPPEPRGGRR